MHDLSSPKVTSIGPVASPAALLLAREWSGLTSSMSLLDLELELHPLCKYSVQ